MWIFERDGFFEEEQYNFINNTYCIGTGMGFCLLAIHRLIDGFD